MQPMNGANWTEMDDAIDKVLKAVRASSANPTASRAAFEELLVVIDSLDKPQ